MAVLIRNANIFLVELCLHPELVAEFNHILKIIRNLNPTSQKIAAILIVCNIYGHIKFIQLLITVIQVSHGISRYLFFVQAQLISNVLVPGPWLIFGRIGLDPPGHKSANTSTIWPKENAGKMLESKLLGKVGKLMKITYDLPTYESVWKPLSNPKFRLVLTAQITPGAPLSASSFGCRIILCELLNSKIKHYNH